MDSEICFRACGWKPRVSFGGVAAAGRLEVKFQRVGQTCLHSLAPGVAASHGVLARASLARPFGGALLPSRIKASMIQSCYAPNFDAF